MNRKVVSIVSGLLVLPLIAACSSSSKTTSRSTTTTSRAATGSPVDVMEITGTGPTDEGSLALPGDAVGVAAINAAGGVQGHPVNLIVCDGHGVNNEYAACAQQAASNPAVVATIGDDSSIEGPEVDPILTAAGIPQIATKPYNPTDYNTPGIFTVEGGGIGISGAMAEYPASQGSKTIGGMVFGVAGGLAVISFLNSVVPPLFPGTKVISIPVTPTASDMTPFAAQAISDKVGAVLLALIPSDAVGAVQQLRAQGFTGSIFGPATSLTNSSLANVSDTSNLFLVSSYNYASPGYARFLAESKQYDPSDTTLSDEAVNGWIGMHMFQNVMNKSSQPLTRAGIMAAFNAVSNYSTDGLTPPLTYTAPNPAKGFSQGYNMAIVLDKVVNRKAVPVTPVEFLNVLTGKLVSGG